MTRLLLPLATLALALTGTASAQDCSPSVAEQRAPILLQIAGDDPAAAEAVRAYVCAYRADALNTSADLFRAIALRDTLVSRLDLRVEGWFFSDEGERYDAAEALYAEAEALALRPVQAEGMIFGLTVGPLMDGVATVLAPADLIHYLDFADAEGEGAGSEYPFSWLDPEVRMILAGEALRRDFPASPYVGATQAAFAEALLTLASLHTVRIEGWDEPQWFAGVGTSEFYPWAAEREALQAFVDGAGEHGSRYAAPFAALLANPSEADGGPLAVVALAGEWGSHEDAAARTLAHLDAGQDVAGPLLIGDGWRVVYRYFPAGDARAGAALDAAEAAGLAVELVTYTPGSE